MAKIGVSVNYGPIRVLLGEHQLVIDLITSLSLILSQAPQDNPISDNLLVSKIKEFIYLMERHMQSEETVLFQVAQAHIPFSEQQRLGKQIFKDWNDDYKNKTSREFLKRLEVKYLKESNNCTFLSEIKLGNRDGLVCRNLKQ